MKIVLTPGEPAGIGPDVVIQIAQKNWDAELIAVADPNLLLTRAKQLNLPLKLTEFNADNNQPHVAGTLKIIPVKLRAAVEPGKLNAANAQYVIDTLKLAADLCLQKKADALVTGPVHKGMMNEAGIAFHGHTEFFADYARVAQTVMMFVIDQLKVALVTTHLPLAQVPKAITKDKLHAVISILQQGLQQQFNIAKPRILVCGLNPHAGENGHLGTEEIDVIAPVLAELSQANYQLQGPLPADTIFTPQHLKGADVILAMYHDQALPLVKYLGFDRAVNVTLGLPFIRTSVDHGTALDIAGTANADAGSMTTAIQLAIDLVRRA